MQLNWKKILTSKTLYLNVLASGALIAQHYVGFIIDPSKQALALAGLNFMNRFLTHEGIVTTPKSA